MINFEFCILVHDKNHRYIFYVSQKKKTSLSLDLPEQCSGLLHYRIAMSQPAINNTDHLCRHTA